MKKVSNLLDELPRTLVFKNNSSSGGEHASTPFLSWCGKCQQWKAGYGIKAQNLVYHADTAELAVEGLLRKTSELS